MTRDYQKDLEVCEKASPRPWKVDGDSVYSPNIIPPVCSFRDRKNINGAMHDSRFISLSREALPYYIKWCMDLEAKNLDLEAQVGQLREALERNCFYCKQEEGFAKKWCNGCQNKETLQTPAPARWEKMQRVVDAAKKALKLFKGEDELCKDCGCFGIEGECESCAYYELKDALAELEGGGE